MYLYCYNCGERNSTTAKYCVKCGTLQQSPNQAPDLLQQRYRLLHKIGAGGFGTVYKCEDIWLNNAPRAAKELQIQTGNPQEIQEAKKAFEQEALLLAKLDHPNLPSVYDHFESQGKCYLIMKFVEGETLHTILSQAPQQKLPLARVIPIALQLCSILHYLHTQNPPIIFRDLKPTNTMLIRDDHLYLIDFGIARLFKPGKAQDTAAFVSPGYAAPEQYGNGQTTGKSDIYSLGATLHHLLSGINPVNHIFRFPPLNLQHEGLAGSEFATLVHHMLQLDEPNRPADIAWIRDQIQRIARLESQPIPPTTTPTIITPSKPNLEKSKISNEMWDRLEADEIQQTPMAGKILKSTGAGLIVEIYAGEGYLSRNNVSSERKSTYKEQDYHNLVGQILQVQVIEAERSRNSLRFQEYTPVTSITPIKNTLPPPISTPHTPVSKQTAEGYADEALDMLNAKRNEDALNLCNIAFQLDPNCMIAYQNASVALINMERYQEALHACDRAIQLDPRNSMLYSNKGSALLGLERYAEALQICNQAITLDFKNVNAHYNASSALLEMHNYTQTLTACNHVLQLDPNYSLAHYNAGIAFFRLQNYHSAIPAFDRCIHLNPFYTNAHASKAGALIRLKQYPTALIVCKQALAIDPLNSVALENMKYLNSIGYR